MLRWPVEREEHEEKKTSSLRFSAALKIYMCDTAWKVSGAPHADNESARLC